MTPRRRIIPVFVPHLGCPHMCVFCNQRRISGEQSPAGAGDVERAVTAGLERLGDNETATLAFYGGSFTAIPAREQEELLGAALPFLRSGRIGDIRLSTRPDAIDEETLDRLERYAVRTVELGVQSMDEEVLRLSERGHSARDAQIAAAMVKDRGFELILQMMTGLPGDTLEKSVATAGKFIKMRPDGVRIYPTVIIRDTPLYDMWLSGAYRQHTVEEAVEWGAILTDMFDEAHIAVVRFGLNPTDDLSAGDAVAGAYHPALGELVLARRFLKRERRLLNGDDRGADVVFAVKKGRVSAATGQKRGNVEALKNEFGLRSVKFVEADMPDVTVRRV